MVPVGARGTIADNRRAPQHSTPSVRLALGIARAGVTATTTLRSKFVPFVNQSARTLRRWREIVSWRPAVTDPPWPPGKMTVPVPSPLATAVPSRPSSIMADVRPLADDTLTRLPRGARRSRGTKPGSMAVDPTSRVVAEPSSPAGNPKTGGSGPA